MPADLVAFLKTAPEWQFWALFAAGAGVSVWCCHQGFRRLRHARLIEDTPTARIRSAAQGFVELEGWAEALPGDPLYTPLSGRPCVWYAYRIEHWRSGRRGGHWVQVAAGRSDVLFALNDGSGTCVVDPEGAQVETDHAQSWRGHDAGQIPPPGHDDPWGAYRYTECWLAEGDRLYALGWFETLRGNDEGGLAAEVRSLLQSWKADQRSLRHRFDLNGDGEIDLREWELVRRQAEKEALRRRMRRSPSVSISVLRQPPQRHFPYMLSSFSQSRLVRRLRYPGVACLAGFILGCAFLAWAIQLRFN